jgi:hypothetical protein
MTDWLTRLWQGLSETIHFGLAWRGNQHTKRHVTQLGNGPLADRWFMAWQRQNGQLTPEDAANNPVITNQPKVADTAPKAQPAVAENTRIALPSNSLSDKEVETVLSSFYGVGKKGAESSKNQAKERLLQQKESSYISRIAQAVRQSSPEGPTQAVAEPRPAESRVPQQTLAQPQQSDTEVTLAAVAQQVLNTPVTQSRIQPPVTINTPNHAHLAPGRAALNTQPKPVSRVNAAAASATDPNAATPNPLAHLVAQNQFLQDRINRLANQYFEDNAE